MNILFCINLWGNSWVSKKDKFLYRQGGPEASQPNAPEENESTPERLVRTISDQLGDVFREQHPELVSYVSYLEDPVNLSLIARIIDDARENITNWPTSDYERAAEFIYEKFPGDEAGRNAFADALLSQRQVETTEHGILNASLYQYAWVHLNVLVTKIMQRKQLHTTTSQLRQDLRMDI